MRSSAVRLSQRDLDEISALLIDSGADGWLLYDFHDQDPLAHRLLGLGRTTRQAFAYLPREGDPVVLRHEIESSVWEAWPWQSRVYRSWQELTGGVRDLLAGATVVAMDMSEGGSVPAIDRVPSGIVDLIRTMGKRVISAADLITAVYSRWTREGLEHHRESAEVVKGVALAAFRRAAAAASQRAPIREMELMDWIRDELRSGGLTDQEDCIVAGGKRSADPHYTPVGQGQLLDRDEILLIDLWGRHPVKGVPADQTWMGYLGRSPSARVVELWSAVRDARDAALRFLAERAASESSVRGWEVDRVARDSLQGNGLAAYFVHRLGHSIDTDLHGSGPNLDDFETHDERRLLPGVGFSVEPGVYLPGEMGVRSEVNVYWSGDVPIVTPTGIQHELLLPADP